MSDLLDFFVDRVTLQDVIILPQLHTAGSILPVLGSDVPGSARHPGFFVLGAFQDNLDPVCF